VAQQNLIYLKDKEKTEKTEEARGTQENREREQRKSQSQEKEKKNNPRKEEAKRETTWTSLRARSVEDEVASRKLHN
jgi:FtsZ-interacting cell division protein YlmF